MPNQNVRRDDAVQAAARNVFVASAPERDAELRELWTKIAPEFQLTPDLHDGERFIMDAGAYRFVRFNHRALRAFWIAAFVAWEGYRAVAESPVSGEVDLTRFSSLVAAFETIISSDAPDEIALPQGIAEPGQLPDSVTDPHGRAAAELAIITTGWALLHEIRHIQHQQGGTSADLYEDDPSCRHAEELSCDEFGVKFLLERADDYAREHNVDAEHVRRKRLLGIYFGLFAITLLAKDKWEASREHPAVQTRIDAIRKMTTSPESEIAEAIAHSAFAALRCLWPTAPGLR